MSARLREVRQYLRLTQDEFASQVGLTRASLASYEDARTPLQLHRGLAICRQFVISERWLAQGQFAPAIPGKPGTPVFLSFGEGDSRVLLSVVSELKLDNHAEKLPYAAGFKKHFAGIFQKLFKERRGSQWPRFELLQSDPLSRFHNIFGSVRDHASALISEDAQKRLLWGLARCTVILRDELTWRSAREIANFEVLLNALEKLRFEAMAYKVVPAALDEVFPKSRQAEEFRENTLTPTVSSANDIAVTATHGSFWKTLQARLRRAMEPRGSQAALAKSLGVTPSAVAQWIAEKASTTPTAETTLRLLHWVDANEVLQQKSPGSATNTTRAKTQVPKSHRYEKETRVRKKV